MWKSSEFLRLTHQTNLWMEKHFLFTRRNSYMDKTSLLTYAWRCYSHTSVFLSHHSTHTTKTHHMNWSLRVTFAYQSQLVSLYIFYIVPLISLYRIFWYLSCGVSTNCRNTEKKNSFEILLTLSSYMFKI